MADKRIIDFPTLEDLDGSDLVLISAGGETFNVSVDTIRRFVGSNSSQNIDSILDDIKEAVGMRFKPRVVIFDDDGTLAEYEKLYPIAQSMQVPMCFAIPVEGIGKSKYCSWDQLQEMAGSPYISYAVHGDVAMSAAMAPSEMTEILFNWFSMMEGKSLLPPVGTPIVHVYPTGSHSDTVIDEAIKPFEHNGYKIAAGLKVTHGINKDPIDLFHMFRNGLFPSGGGYTMSQVKADIDAVKEQGGILCLFTHAYYDTFSGDDLIEIINYTRESGVEIVSVADALTAYAEYSEKKNAAPVAPAPDSTESWEEPEITVIDKKLIAKATSSTPGMVIDANSTSTATVSAGIDVTGYSKIRVVGCTAGYGEYAFYSGGTGDANGSNPGVLVQPSYSTATSGAQGKFDKIIDVPAGAEIVRVAGLGTQNVAPKVYGLLKDAQGISEARVREIIREELQNADVPQDAAWVDLPVEVIGGKRIASEDDNFDPGTVITDRDYYVTTQIPCGGLSYARVRVKGRATQGDVICAQYLADGAFNDYARAEQDGAFDMEISIWPETASIRVQSGGEMPVVKCWSAVYPDGVTKEYVDQAVRSAESRFFESIAEISEDLEAAGDAINKIQASISIDDEEIPFNYQNANLYTSTIDSIVDIERPNSSSQWMLWIIPVKNGDRFSVIGNGGQSPRLWAFLDTDKKVLSNATAGKNAKDEPVAIKSVSDGYLIVNSNYTESRVIKHGGLVDIKDVILETRQFATDLVSAAIADVAPLMVQLTALQEDSLGGL